MEDLQTLRAWAAEERYQEVLAEIAAIKAAGYEDAALLVLESLVVQAGDGDGATLEDAKAALQKASGLSEDHPEAHIEAGYYTLNVDDDAAAAIPHFDKALDRVQGLAIDAVAGMAKSIQERDGEAAAARFLEEAAQRILDPTLLKAKLE